VPHLQLPPPVARGTIDEVRARAGEGRTAPPAPSMPPSAVNPSPSAGEPACPSAGEPLVLCVTKVEEASK
jgi:hypothetical protein